MYKLLIVVALAVACLAEPEASPEAYRGGKSRYGGGGYGGRGRSGHGGYRGKRSAEAEAEADAAPEADAEADPGYLYGGAYAAAPYAARYISPYAARYAAAYAPYSAYSTYGYGLNAPAYYGGGHYLGKREAEAEPIFFRRGRGGRRGRKGGYRG